MTHAAGDGASEKPHGPPAAGQSHEREKLWQVRRLRLAAAAALLLGAGWLAARFGAGTAGTVLELAAAAVGGAAFAPGAVRALRRGRIGVGTLMTIALVGAIVLGAHGEAAMLGVLFSVSEGLEDYAVTRALAGLARAAGSGARAGHGAARRPGTHRFARGVAGGRADGAQAGQRAATDGVIRAGPHRAGPVGDHR